ncbi:MAG: penicillin-binding protein 2 [bacterium]
MFSLVLVTKLYFVQIVSGDSYREKAEHQYTAPANYFDRGSIFFSSKNGSLLPAATVQTGFIVALNTEFLTENLEDIYSSLNQIIPIDHDEFITKASKVNDKYEEVAKRITSEEAEKIQELKISGLSLVRERWRVYPGNKIAAHAIGLIGYQGDELSGRYGLERFYEDILGRAGDDAFVNFFAEIFSNIKKGISDSEELEGDIITTLEPTIESTLESELERVNKKYSSEFTGGIVINPQTGEIYAMALYPSFDPNAPQNEAGSSIFRNKFVEDRYEMGSIIKPLTLAAGIDAGAITARTTYNDPGCVTLNKKTFCNYDGKSHGDGVTMQTALSQSLNTGMAFAVSKMGNKTFADYMLKFGLDEITGIDLPNEGDSLVSNLKSSRDLEYAQASFGQGIALTPIITVRALSAIANGGTLITPHLVKEIHYKIGTIKKIEPVPVEERVRVIRPETSEEISRILTEVVDRTLKKGTVRFENYSVAAKTGTAQIAKEGGGGYYDDRYLHSFFGYFPSYDPRFLIFLYTYYPKDVQYASETLTDTFISMTKFLINYYNLPPDRESAPPEPSFNL